MPQPIRVLFVSAGNPVNSVPGGLPVEELDLLVCIDLYVSDTARSADYILPGTTFLEREDLTDAQKREIMGQNPQRFYGFTVDVPASAASA